MKKLLLSFALLHGGCAGEEDDHHGEEHGETGTPSGAACDSTLTYENFGMTFMASYCTHCHSSTLTGTARNGAPEDHDFDTLEGILLVAEHIDEYAAAGPDATNEDMPPTGAAPTQDEREMLGAWLACELAP
jgi:uncharacterized membrane protein